MKPDFQITFTASLPNERCFFCNKLFESIKIQICALGEAATNVLVICYSCFESVTAVGLEALWKIAPATMETQ